MNKLVKIGLIPIVCFVVLTGFLSSKNINAATGDPTGSCGALMDINHKNINPAVGMAHGSSALMLINFDILKITAKATVTSYPTGFPVNPEYPSYETETIGPISFSMIRSDVPNVFTITPDASSGIPEFSAISVNSGQTFLLQARNDRGSGVCQKL